MIWRVEACSRSAVVRCEGRAPGAGFQERRRQGRRRRSVQGCIYSGPENPHPVLCRHSGSLNTLSGVTATGQPFARHAVNPSMGALLKRPCFRRSRKGLPGIAAFASDLLDILDTLWFLRSSSYGKISIGVPVSTIAQISSISGLVTAIQPLVQFIRVRYFSIFFH